MSDQTVAEIEEEIVALERQARAGGSLGAWAQQEVLKRRADLQLEPVLDTSYEADDVWTPPTPEVTLTKAATDEPSLEDQLVAAKKVVKSLKARIAEESGAGN